MSSKKRKKSNSRSADSKSAEANPADANPADSNPSDKGDKIASRWTAGRMLRIGLLMVAVLGVAYGLTLGIVWLKERPLMEATELLEAEDPSSALVVIEDYLDANPDDSRAKAIQARALVGVERYEDAVEIYDVIKEDGVEDMRASSTARLHLQQWDKAIPLLMGILYQDPNDPDALHSLVSCQHILGYYGDAAHNAERLSKVDGYEAQGEFLSGLISLKMTNNEEADMHWKRVVELNPEFRDMQISPAEFYSQYGQLKLELGDAEKALEYFDQSLTQQQHPETNFGAGRAALALGDPTAARKYWIAALQLDPIHVEARESLANEALREGLPKQAIQVLVPLAEANILNSSIAYILQRAHVMLEDEENAAIWQEEADRLRKREELEAAISSAMLQAPQSYWSRVMRSYQFAETGNWEQAMAIAQPLLAEHGSEPFLRKLVQAIIDRGELPPLEEVPIDLF